MKGILVIVVIGVIGILVSLNLGISIGQIIEVSKEIGGFLHSVVSPTYQLDDVDEERLPSNNLQVRANHSQERLTKSFSVLSWNIYRNHYAKEIEESLEKLVAGHEIVLLQEVPTYNDSSFWDNPLFEGYSIVFAPYHQVRKQGGLYEFKESGQMIAAEGRVLESQAYDLPTVTHYEIGEDHTLKRVMVYTKIEREDGKKVGVYNIHLENVAGPLSRAKQARYVLDILENNEDDIVIVGGDFNSLFGSRIERSVALFEDAGFERAYKNEFRMLPRLDYFFVRGINFTEQKVEGAGSDHNPISIRIS